MEIMENDAQNECHGNKYPQQYESNENAFVGLVVVPQCLEQFLLLAC